MKAVIARYCEEACGSLKPSERQCHSGVCHLARFADRYFEQLPEETMDAVGDTVKSADLRNCLEGLDWAAGFVDKVSVEGNAATVMLGGGGRGRTVPAGLPIALIYRAFTAGPAISTLTVFVRKEEGAGLWAHTTRGRAIALVGHDGYERIRTQWADVWDWFRAAREGDEAFIDSVRRYLAGEDVDVRFRYLEQLADLEDQTRAAYKGTRRGGLT